MPSASYAWKELENYQDQFTLTFSFLKFEKSAYKDH